MTIARLEQYRTLKRQIKMYCEDNGLSYINGVDTSKPAVQSGRISDTTADNALTLCEKLTAQEYQNLCSEFKILNEYIYGICNFEVREIAKLKFIMGYTYEQIAEKICYEPTTVARKLRNYIKSH